MSLRTRLILIYTSLICLAVLTLGVISSRLAGELFADLVRDNIDAESRKIAESITALYDPWTDRFNVETVEALGMYFVHEGYILSVEAPRGEPIWDARSCDMEQCAAVIGDITRRMEQDYRMSGGLQTSGYPLNYLGREVGQVFISTYGPYFYSSEESGFLQRVNRFVILTALAFTVLSLVVSVFFAYTLSRPILKAASAAKHIAGGDLTVRIPEGSRTRELRELSRSVNDLAEALEKGERWQKRLSADIAHELRTPLTCLQGNIEAMIDGVWEPTAEHLSSCHEEIVRLNKLVEDLSRLSILERDSLVLRRRPFDLGKLLSAAAEQFLPAAREKGIEIRLEPPPPDPASGPAASPATDPVTDPVTGDYDRLMQVFINLISNGVKYTDQGAVTIRAARFPDHYEVSVTDTGIGIGGEELPRVFDRFYRTARSRGRRSEGSGIGLSIAKTIVEAHGGAITVESGVGRGSVFRVSLPLQG